MKKFKFRLHAIEKHRTMKEQEARVRLTKAVEFLRNIENKLMKLDEKEVEARREFAALGAGANGSHPSVQMFWMLDQFIRGQKYRRVDLKTQLQTEEKNVTYAYQDFLGARQQKKIIEKLRERSQNKYNDALAKHEQRVVDSLYTMRFRLVNKQGEEPEND